MRNCSLGQEAAEVLGLSGEVSGCAARSCSRYEKGLAIYAHTVDMHSPPAQVRERLMRQVARERKPVPVELPAVAETGGGEMAIQVWFRCDPTGGATYE